MSGSDLDTLCVNTIRFLAADAVQKAKSGHPGMPMGAAAMAYVLWTRFLRHNPADPTWPDRDRFVLSAGHGSMLLYALLHLTGYDLSLDELKRFRQWGSKTPGHPEYGLTPGVDATTGPLGQGLGNAVGMAIAERHLAARFNRPEHTIVEHHTYAICSDGDLMEGVAAEAVSLAGHLGLGRLIVLYDDNLVSLAGKAALSFSEDVPRRFEGYGWHTQVVPDGNDLEAVDKALRGAQAEAERPSLIAVRTVIGYGAPKKQGTHEAHGEPLGEEELRAAKQALGWPLEPSFLIPDAALARFREARARGAQWQSEWHAGFEAYAQAHSEPAAAWRDGQAGTLTAGWDATLPAFGPETPTATRDASGATLAAVSPRLPALIGGDADLAPSTKTLVKTAGSFLRGSYDGRHIHYGVREHAMGAISNGLAYHGGLIVFCGTFFNFSDYMRPAVRLAALSELPVIYVWTHDSIGLGEDGPTHQPIEQLAALRAMPHLVVIRPADANETVVAWKVALARRQGPTALVLTRQKVPVLDRTVLAPAAGLARGAYVLADDGPGPPDIILIGTGSEVQLVVAAQAALAKDGVRARAVSMPSWELFAAEPADYREAVLPRDVGRRLAVEAASPFGWERWVGPEGVIVGLNRYGASAPGEGNMRELGFTTENVVARARALLGR
ncbi:MAG TPA: transketolase [Methylomirabilota bacterium]|jgi:transketolase|nr:transketolase [Methylomirabilota bacterium]